MDSERRRQCRHVPPNKLQRSFRITSGNEQMKNVRCWDNHADESCTVSMTKKIIKRFIDCRKRSTLTCYPSVPTLQKDCGETSRQTNGPSVTRIALNISSIRFWMNQHDIHRDHRYSIFNCWRSNKCTWPWAHPIDTECDSRTRVVNFLDLSKSSIIDWWSIKGVGLTT